MIALFRRRPDPSSAGRELAELACLNSRERVRARARARLMREQMGLPPAKELESRK